MEHGRSWLQKYLGTNKPTNCIKTGVIKKLAKSLPADINLINSLFTHATTFEEMAIAASIIGQHQQLVQDLDLSYVDNWLNYTVGWAEVDSLCQSNFHAVDLLSRWPEWKKLLTKLSKDKNVNKRRASLVLLCKSLGESNDPRLLNFSLELVERLKSEKEILITKAISWVLRQMVKHHSIELEQYLSDNHASLPKIAYRETLKKLITGKKS